MLVSVLSTGVVSPLALLRAGFFPTDRQVAMMFDAPRDLVRSSSFGGPLHFELL